MGYYVIEAPAAASADVFDRILAAARDWLRRSCHNDERDRVIEVLVAMFTASRRGSRGGRMTIELVCPGLVIDPDFDGGDLSAESDRLVRDCACAEKAFFECSQMYGCRDILVGSLGLVNDVVAAQAPKDNKS